MKFLLAALLILFTSPSFADDKLPALDDVSSILAAADQKKFELEKQGLEEKLKLFQTAGNAFNAKPVENQTDEEFNALEKRQANYIAAANAFNENLFAAWIAHIVSSMKEAARNSTWSAEKKNRAQKALDNLNEDGTSTTNADIRRIWKDLHARPNNKALAHKASQGKGPGLPGSGNQTIYEDCAIFALANAAGVPYSVAAARTAEFIRDGKWRTAEERANPQKIIEQNGLMGGEVILVAEAFGKAALVPSSEFENTLKEGRPIMVNLYPYNGSLRSGHEVVLTKTFQHDGGTWFEMIDSNEKGTHQRLYMNKKDLGMLLKENGVSIYPEENRTPALLRTPDSK